MFEILSIEFRSAANLNEDYPSSRRYYSAQVYAQK